MVADIFISYSSKDKEKADQLSELLASAGLSVWIDRQGIVGAEKWATEIVEGIRACNTFIILLSPNSIESENVLRELSLASEKRKRVLPVDLEAIVLPSSFEYPLAGLQRVPFVEFDRIVHAHRHGVEKIIRKDERKSLMILPFEDLSPTGDNGWFADGIVSELISALSNVKSIRIADNQATKEFKKYHGQLTTYAREMDIRYFVQGDVRKFGDQIKISSRLLDIETGDNLWQESMRGTMENIFDFQEEVALKVVEGLKVHLGADEKKKLAERGTENAEAYELLLKGTEYANRRTRSDYERAFSLYEEAVRIDPGFTAAYASLASASQELYRNYSRSAAHLERARSAAMKVLELEGETAQYFWVMSLISISQGESTDALRFALRAVETEPAFAPGYDTLGSAYESLGRLEEAVQAREEVVRLRENYLNAHFGLIIVLSALGETQDRIAQLRMASERAIGVYGRHIRLNPDDYDSRVQLAAIFQMAGRDTEALTEAETLSSLQFLDGGALYNLACIYVKCQQVERAMEMLRRSVEKGFMSLENFRHDPDLDPLRGREEFEALISELEITN